MPVNSSQHGNNTSATDLPVDLHMTTCGWYFSKDEIDNHSPSRKDGIDRVRESSLRKSYCSFLKDLGIRLRVSPVTTATAMMFCHRFYMRQSHAKNDWQTVATACMFLASKVEDNLRPLRDVTLVSYEMIYKWDPSASERIKQREVYYKQKELILVAENLVLVTIAFDFNIQHPFKPLVDALKRLKISNNDVAKAAWNLVNEWLRTTLCLQYKPHYVAAASLSVAAKLLNFKLPAINGQAWWLQFDVIPKQLQEVTEQMLRYFKHDEKHKEVQVPANVTKPSLNVENHTTQSAQSSITVGSDSNDKATALTCQEQKPHQFKNAQTQQDSNRVMVKTAYEQAGRQKGPTLPINMTTPTLKRKSESCQSAHSSITIGSDIDEVAQLCKYKQKVRAESNKAKVNAASNLQSCDCCSGISGAFDPESIDKSSKIVSVDDALAKIDVNRLKGAFQRAKCLKRTKNKVFGLESELDSDLLIESELEKGVELEYEAVKRQKV